MFAVKFARKASMMSKICAPSMNMSSSPDFYRVVLVRHGESTWNDENRFTGWYDCPLSEKGHKEAVAGNAHPCVFLRRVLYLFYYFGM